MAVIARYNDENLASFDGVTDSFSGRSIFAEEIYQYLRASEYIFVDASRKNYDLDGLREIKKIAGIENWRDREFSLAFGYEPGSDDVAFVKAMLDVWFAYEHAGYICLTRRPTENERSSLYELLGKQSWKEITANTDSYVFFRAIGEDVVWLGKSASLNFL